MLIDFHFYFLKLCMSISQLVLTITLIRKDYKSSLQFIINDIKIRMTIRILEKSVWWVLRRMFRELRRE